MSDLGEISAELSEALTRLERVLARFSDLDRNRLASIQAELGRRPDGRQAAAFIARARGLLRQAGEGTLAARRAGEGWLSQHGSDQGGGSGGQEFQAGSRSPGFESQSSFSTGFETLGGRAYFRPEEREHRISAKVLPAFPGEYTLDAHGASQGVLIDGQWRSASEVAALIEADPRWGGRPVRLFVCETGLGEAPIAQEIANILGVPVTAPVGIAWSSSEGDYGVYPVRVTIVNGVVVERADEDVEGIWRVFHPD